MRVFFAEFKKIFNLKCVAVAAAVFIIFVLLWDCWRIDPLPFQGEWEVDVIERYGPVLTQEEAHTALNEYIPELEKQADELIASEPLFGKIGITNHDDYYFRILNGPFDVRCRGEFTPDFYPELTPEEFEAEYGMTFEEAMQPVTADELAVYNKYMVEWSDQYGGQELNSVVRKINSFKGQIEYAYDGKDRLKDIMVSHNKDEAEKARVAEIFDTDEFYNVSYDNAFYKIQNVSAELPVILMLVMLIIIAPTVTRDNMTGVSYLQYSSKAGRKIASKQLLAVLAAGGAVILIFSALWALRLMLEIPNDVFAAGLNGFNTVHEVFWFKGSLGGFAALIFTTIIMAAVGFAFALFCASFTSHNYIQLIVKLIPCAIIYIGFFFVFGSGFYALDYYSSNVYDILHIPFGELIICGVLLVVPAVVSFALIAKNKGRELE